MGKKITGYFVAMGEEIKEKTRLLAGRSGVFFEKETLIQTILGRESLEKEKLLIVEIEANTQQIANANKEKFGIKANVMVKKVEKFQLCT